MGGESWLVGRTGEIPTSFQELLAEQKTAAKGKQNVLWQ